MKPESFSETDSRSLGLILASKVESSGETDIEGGRRRAIAAAGRFHSGVPDISTKHDEYLFADTLLNSCAPLFCGQRLEGESRTTITCWRNGMAIEAEQVEEQLQVNRYKVQYPISAYTFPRVGSGQVCHQ